MTPPEASTSTWRRATLAFGLLVIGFGTIAILLDTGTTGHTRATERTTIEIHTRATAVLEPGSELRWHVGPGGVAEVEQSRGDVVYRVPEGPPIHLRAGALALEVHDAVFRLSHVDGEVETHVLMGRVRARAGDDRAAVGAGHLVRTESDGLGARVDVGPRR